MKFKKQTPLKVKIQIKLLQLAKKIYHLTKNQQDRQKDILFIIGCQRSGTSVLTRIFERDYNTVVYHEFHRKVVHLDTQRKLRLKPLDVVKRVIDQAGAPLVILKPLVETQRALELLHYFEDSKALWVYRHYRDVAISNLRQFGMDNGIKNLRTIVANEAENWRSEHVSPQVRAMVLEHFSEKMNPYDAAALFWFVRNSLFFELNLDKNPKVIMCKYEELVANPAETMKKIYDFMGHDFPGERTVAEIKAISIGRRNSIELSPKIEFSCQKLLQDLDEVFTQKELTRATS